MKKHLPRNANPRPSRRFSSGLTLIEMMVSLAIGMVVVVAIVALYAGTSGASATADAQGRMNEDAQAALSILTQDLRMAGSNPKQPNRTSAAPRNPIFDNTTYSLRGCEGKFSNITSAASPAALACGGGTTTLPDSIAVSYEADKYNTSPTTTGAPTDCLGAALNTVSSVVTIATSTGTVTASVNYYVADNRYYVDTPSGASAPSLYCKGVGTTQPLVENVEDIQFTYGTAPAGTRTGTVAGYLDAVGVETDTTADDTGATLASLATSPARWGRVTTVRICVLVRSERSVAPDTGSAKYYGCNSSSLTTPSDLRLRKAYYSTVVLRNRLDPP
jgi:type IV pilus assembly protein PilW